MNGAKVFVKLDDCKDIIDIMGLIKEKISESQSILERLKDLKNQEDSELDLWSNTLENVKSKADYIDKALFQEHV